MCHSWGVSTSPDLSLLTVFISSQPVFLERGGGKEPQKKKNHTELGKTEAEEFR